jgi:hypothetical protein
MIKAAVGDSVPMVPMQMGQHDGVELGEFGNGQSGFGEPFRGQAVTEVCPLPTVQEIRVRQQGQRTKPDQGGPRSQ